MLQKKMVLALAAVATSMLGLALAAATSNVPQPTVTSNVLALVTTSMLALAASSMLTQALAALAATSNELQSATISSIAPSRCICVRDVPLTQ